MGPVVTEVRTHLVEVSEFDPGVLRKELHALATASPAEAAREVPVRVAAALWESMREDLEQRGVTLAGLREAARGYRRELWLWVMGERPWSHTFASLLGRAERRAA
ncbi:MAG TPA: hypothetical protein VGS21_05220 [Acidimicrobiales bacterium]|nr:hypothetical protein [Acidimicrobiales bacterium]